MALKDILVLLDAEAPAAAAYAVGLAAASGASVTAAAAVIEPVPPTTMFASWPEEMRAQMLDEAETTASTLITAFTATASRHGIVPEARVIRTRSGELPRELARIARAFDVTILGQGGEDAPHLIDLSETALFGSGRPILVVPRRLTEYRPIETAVVAWDGSQTAARAVADALPFLALAARVEIVTVVDAPDEASRSALADVTRHLARHGIEAEPKPLISVGDVANTLLSHAADEDVGLLVMGGYGHSRAREAVLGGATRDMLRSMTVPVLMSH